MSTHFYEAYERYARRIAEEKERQFCEALKRTQARRGAAVPPAPRVGGSPLQRPLWIKRGGLGMWITPPA